MDSLDLGRGLPSVQGWMLDRGRVLLWVWCDGERTGFLTLPPLATSIFPHSPTLLSFRLLLTHLILALLTFSCSMICAMIPFPFFLPYCHSLRRSFSLFRFVHYSTDTFGSE